MTRRRRGAVDLGRERRIRRALDELGTLLDGNPRLAERTAAMLRGDLDAPDLEDSMTNEIQVTVRVPADVPERADALAERMAAAPEFAAWRVTKSAVLRLAMLRGLEVLEAEHPKGGRRRG